MSDRDYMRLSARRCHYSPLQVPGDPKQKARQAVRAAQKEFERESTAVQGARRQAFARAQKEGLSLQDIADEVGLHRSRVGQIISGK